MKHLLNISKRQFLEDLNNTNKDKDLFLGNGVNCHVHDDFKTFSTKNIAISLDENLTLKLNEESDPTSKNLENLLKDKVELTKKIKAIFACHSILHLHTNYSKLFQNTHLGVPLYDGIYTNKVNELLKIQHYKFEKDTNDLIQGYQSALALTDLIKLLKFFTSKSTNIFTTNYDLLLIWLMKYQHPSHESLNFEDGFIGSNQEYKWKSFDENKNYLISLNSNICFYTDGDNIKRLFYTDNEQIPVKILDRANEGQIPYLPKEQNINGYLESKGYFREGIKKLQSNRDIYLLGSSINFEDKNIWDKLNGAGSKNVYIGLHKEDAEEVNSRAKKIFTKEVKFYNSEWLWEFASQIPNPDPRE